LTFVNVPQNFEDTILDLHKGQLAKQQQRTTQKHNKSKSKKTKTGKNQLNNRRMKI